MVALLTVGLFPSLVWADPAAPTNLQFESVSVFHHVIEEDDFVLIFHYNIHYDASQPDESANKLFTFRLLDTNGIDHLGAVVPYAYYNSGYDQGCGAFYFSAEDAPAWEQAYVVRISGNPEYFSSPPLVSRTLILSDYSQLETQGENQAVLGNYIIEIGRDLETNWSAELLFVGDTGTMLNPTGESYFKGAITGLQAMAPQIFPIRTTSPQYEETEWTEAQGEAYRTRFLDTWFGEALQSLGNLFHVPWNFVSGMFIIVAVIVMAVFCQWQYGNVKAVAPAAVCLLLGGTVSGWWSPAILAIINIFVGGLFLGYVWMFRHG